MKVSNDPILNAIARELLGKYRCHTVILYGSRARGLATPTSDYDVFGVTRTGKMTRIAKKQNGYFWDVFVYAEKDLRKLDDVHFAWKGAVILYANGRYGRSLLKRVEKHVARPYPPKPKYEISITRTWAQKELERCRVKDTQGLYRRAEFQMVLVEHYFFMRQKRFWGPKAGLAWLEVYDPKTFALIRRALKSPGNLAFLKTAAERVYGVRLE